MPIVKHTLDMKKQAKLSKQSLERLDAIGENDIDYSDIPELTDELFAKRIKVQFGADKSIKL